jgi:hypothetical protein
MKNTFSLLSLLMLLSACSPAAEKPASAPLIGTWRLIAATSTERDSTYSTFNARNEMIKIITPTHFAFFNHDLNHGRDSTASYSAGGGTYTLRADSVYTEHLQYFNLREWEDHQFEFVVRIKNDTLTQRGVEKLEALGIDRIIEEKYVRVK